MRLLMAAAVAALSMAAGPASAAFTIEFEELDMTPLESYSVQGVTFTTIGEGRLWAATSPNTSKGLLSVSGLGFDFQPIGAVFDTAVDFFRVDIGDFGVDADTVWLRLFDASDNELAYVSDTLAADFTGMKTLSYAGSGIARVEMGGIGADGKSSIQIDNVTSDPNFVFVPPPPDPDPVGDVPEPATWAMMLLGFGGMGAVLRRRRLVLA